MITPHRLAISAALALASASPAQPERPVRVFVLAGQSNMEGKARNELLERQAADPATAAEWAPWRQDGGWVARDDVFVDFLGRRGRLGIGFGSRGCTGVELELGRLLGEHFADPVLLVKTAWGGHALARQFRPPSAGVPDDDSLAAEVEQARLRAEERAARGRPAGEAPTLQQVREHYGSSYRAMLREVRAAMAECGDRFPELAGRTPVLSGLEEAYPTWREEPERWQGLGSDHGYHYLGSGVWLNRIGRAMAAAMLELQQPRAGAGVGGPGRR